MAHSLIDRPGATGFSFDTVTCEMAHPGGAPAWCRLSGRARDDRMLVLDFAGGRAEPPLPARLDAARLEPVAVPGLAPASAPASAPSPTSAPAAAQPTLWRLDSAQGRYEIRGARLFVHEDVVARAAVVIPPRPVPFAKRAFWRLVFALLATPFGRRWLERRAAG